MIPQGYGSTGSLSDMQTATTFPLLSADGILETEFEYIAQTAFQANEDRARVTNLYLVTIGGLIAALLSSQVDTLNLPNLDWGFAVLFAVLGFASILTLLQLVRLREAWFQSVIAMNQIKQFYIHYYGKTGLDLESAFAWSNTTSPARFKPWSISFLLALQVSLVGATAFGTCIIFAGLAYSGNWWWTPALLVGLGSFGAQIFIYRQAVSG
jgi:hypothetical protein